jgi:hypothetical protein
LTYNYIFRSQLHRIGRLARLDHHDHQAGQNNLFDAMYMILLELHAYLSPFFRDHKVILNGCHCSGVRWPFPGRIT